MTIRTKSRIWMTNKPTVIFMVPPTNHEIYAEVMNQLTMIVIKDLNWKPDSINLIGLISSTAEHGVEGIYFLEEMGIDTRSLTLLILWGKTSDVFPPDKKISSACGVGGVVLPDTGVILPVVCMPSIESKWWHDPLHQEFAAVTYAKMIQDGKSKLESSEPYVFFSNCALWN